jgi:hypothetical protein
MGKNKEQKMGKNTFKKRLKFTEVFFDTLPSEDLGIILGHAY